ncbi:MAG: hypothetical protein GX616_12315 [Planctomycetes bacterium]|nr:hypothetical protein [Planctomycetota bacterium]
MRLQKVNLKQILAELGDLPSDWMDDQARELIHVIRDSLSSLRRLKHAPAVTDLAAMLEHNPAFLDVCRLLMGEGQESAAHRLCKHLDMRAATWSRLRLLARQDPTRMASAIVALGVPDLIVNDLRRNWTLEDILLERYRMSRGRAIAGQKRGRALEDRVEQVLRGIPVAFEPRVRFIGKRGQGAKCDFAIIGRDHPKIVVEAKGFEATGSKLTDFLGDVLKIGQVKEYHTYFFLVTDGRGWLNRESDLKRLIEYHNEGLVDMIYTQARLEDFARHVKAIIENE